MESSARYGVTVEQLRMDVFNTLRRYFKGRDWFDDEHHDLLLNAIIEIVDATKFRRTDGIDGWMYLFVYADGSISVDYNVLDHFKENADLAFRWSVCGNDTFRVVLYDYSKDLKRKEI